LTADQDKLATSTTRTGDIRQVFRSPVVLAVWWIWVVFAVANLVDLAVQGHDHISLVAALILILVTGVMYVAAWRPRVVAEDAELTIVNPLRDHRIGWAAVSGVEAAEMLRVRCEWPGGRKAFYAWAVNSSRRRQITAQLRAERAERRARPRRDGAGGGFGAPRPAPAPAPAPAAVQAPDPNDADRVISVLKTRADGARAGARDGAMTEPYDGAARPLSTWYWPAFAAIVVPALALVIAILV
jgi:hypothetical protein